MEGLHIVIVSNQIDWAADDLYHLKVKQLKVFLQDHKLKMSGLK